MKTPCVALLLLASLFFSCQLEEPVVQTDNYWDSNYLRMHKLRGPVHTLTSVEPNGTLYLVFDRKGNPISGYTTQNRFPTSDTSTWSKTYAGGRLVRSTTLPFNHSDASETTTHYEYGFVGKYIPDPEQLFMGKIALIPGLSAQYSDTYRYDFTFYGTELWVVRSQAGMDNDTTIVQYAGNYPSSFTNRTYQGERIEYAENGMIKSYQVLTMQGYRKMVYTYLPDKTYQLLDNVVTTDLVWETQTNALYNYNDHQDLLELISDNGLSFRYSNYAYDSKGNWTRRDYSRRTESFEPTWSDTLTYTQKITYY